MIQCIQHYKLLKSFNILPTFVYRVSRLDGCFVKNNNGQHSYRNNFIMYSLQNKFSLSSLYMSFQKCSVFYLFAISKLKIKQERSLNYFTPTFQLRSVLQNKSRKAGRLIPGETNLLSKIIYCRAV